MIRIKLDRVAMFQEHPTSYGMLAKVMGAAAVGAAAMGAIYYIIRKGLCRY